MIIRNPEYFKAITSPRRMEIISSLGDSGPASIQELAARLGLSPHTLYYHMRLLERAGIVFVQEERKAVRRAEAVYALRADRIFLEPDPGSQRSLDAAGKSLDLVLRMTSREVRTALQSGVSRAGPYREVYGVRIKARIPKSGLRKINRHLDEIERMVRKEDRNGGGKLYALTLVLTPAGITSA